MPGFSLALLVKAVIVAALVGLGCIFVGSILATIGVPIAETIGKFLTVWGWAIGVLFGLWYYFTGGSVSVN